MRTFATEQYTGNSDLLGSYEYYSTEQAMLIHFVRWFRKSKFDIITGWNVDAFDMTYIMNRIINIFNDEEGQKVV